MAAESRFNDAVELSNFQDCQLLRKHKVPNIETIIINDGGGLGEAGVPPVAPALTNPSRMQLAGEFTNC